MIKKTILIALLFLFLLSISFALPVEPIVPEDCTKLSCEGGVNNCLCGGIQITGGAKYCCEADNAVFDTKSQCLASTGCKSAGLASCSTRGGASCNGPVTEACKCGSKTAHAGEYCCGTDSFTAPSQYSCGQSPSCEGVLCSNDCSPVSNCLCGAQKVDSGVERYCSPDNTIYLTEAECETNTPMGPALQGGAITNAITELSSSLEIISSWQALTVLAIVFSIILVALGYMVGIGFDMPEMQAWASTELRQVFSNAIIVLFLLAIATFLDLLVMEVVNSSGIGNFHCSVGENCLNKTSQAYLKDYIDMGKDEMKNVLEDSDKAGALMNVRVGIYYNRLLPLLQLGMTTTFMGQYMLDFDRLGIIFNHYQSILSSLEAQRFFLSEFSFKIGPILLAIGIVCRSFFLTRKFGGLLIAIGASILVVFPAMYIFDWMSLDLASTGDLQTGIEAGDCPVECTTSPPIAYYGTTKVSSLNELYGLFDESEYDAVRNLSLGKTKSLVDMHGETVYSCDYGTDCNRSCRELPYPSTNSDCTNTTAKVQEACSKLTPLCKVVRLVPEESMNMTEYDSCPAECKTIPPLKSDCRNEDCLDSRFDCRAAKLDNLTWRPTMPEGMKGKEKCEKAKDCIANDTDAFSSCTWVIPELGSCDNICSGCPSHCRTDITTGLPTDCYKSDNTTLIDKCTSCPSTCKAKVSELDPSLCGGSSGCSLTMRLMGTDLGPEYTLTPCDEGSCPYNSTYRAEIPFSACEQCIYSEEPYEYNPPIRTNCADLCKPNTNTQSKNSGDYTKIDGDGLIGRTEIKNVSKLYVPAYFLPLINIAMTLISIRFLSGILGGDIEIPGISRIF